jgi:hypothetical protein
MEQVKIEKIKSGYEKSKTLGDLDNIVEAMDYFDACELYSAMALVKLTTGIDMRQDCILRALRYYVKYHPQNKFNQNTPVETD